MIRITPTSFDSQKIAISKPLRIVDFFAKLNERITSSESSSIIQILDKLVNRSVGASYLKDYQLYYSTFGGIGEKNVSFESLNPDKATVNSSGLVSYTSNGNATIKLKINNAEKTITLSMESVVGNTVDTFISFVDGSLAKHCSDIVDTRIANKSANDALRIFTTQNHATQTYVRNPNLWCADLPNVLTPISPWNSSGANTRAGTLISPRHILFAAHYEIGTGATVRFVDANGNVVNRIMTAKLTHPSYVPYYPDITIGVLDSDVPPSINFCRVLPDNFSNKCPSVTMNGTVGPPIPCLTLDQEEKALVTDLVNDVDGWTSFYIPANSKRLEFYENKIVGDSGNPAILIVNNQPVLLTVWTFGGAGAGTSVRAHKTAINTMMTTLGGGYQLTEIDLSGFPSY